MHVNVIRVRNVQEALPEGLRYLSEWGAPQLSRAGDVVQAPGPVLTVYTHPWECVVLSPVRDANPFFHLAEVVWMMAGRDDAAFLIPYVKDFGRYAEDDGHIHGAYGARWRRTSRYDQLEAVAEKLRRDPGTRQAVLQMWDAGGSGSDDLRAAVADRPCNTHIYFRVRNAALDMTVCCRSNDILMGAYGANAVHFAYLHAWVSAAAGYRQGEYCQFSHDYHAYTADLQRLWGRTGKPAVDVGDAVCTPRKHHVLSTLADALRDVRGFPSEPPMVDNADTFLAEAEAFCRVVHRLNTTGDFVPDGPPTRNHFFSHTAAPALATHWQYRNGGTLSAIRAAADIESPAWRTACVEWLQRRVK